MTGANPLPPPLLNADGIKSSGALVANVPQLGGGLF